MSRAVDRHRFFHAGVALGLLGAATAARWLLDPVLVDHLPYATYFVAITLIAWATTTPIAAGSLLLGWLLSDFLFIPPRLEFHPLGFEPQYVVGSIAYFAVGATSIAVSHEMRAAQRRAAESSGRLHEMLSDAHLLQRVATDMAAPAEPKELYERLTAAAADVMRSDFASMQMLFPERGELGELLLLAQRGFDAEATARWKWVGVGHATTCGVAFRTRRRCHVSDVERSELIQGEDRRQYLSTGIRAVQSTPLLSRSGALLGMISTHWKTPHEPGERDWRMFDTVARHASDLIERAQSELALQEAARRKDEFLALLAHELRNPLAPIRNAVELLRHGPGRASRDVTEMLERQVGQLVRLVDDLLDLSRITRGKVELRQGTTDLASVVGHAVETARPWFDGSRRELTIGLPPEPLHVHGDSARLAQALGNLLHNACKFTDDDGRIGLTLEREGAHAVIRVRDDGIGVAAAQLSRIFEPFVQGDNSIERTRTGLGIGLTLVRQLVELHGGTVEARSEGLGTGSEFVVRLPALPPQQRVAATGERREKPAAAVPRRILVVDDNRDAADSLALLLRLSGHESHIAYDGAEALRKTGELRPDVIFLDIGLPRMNGYDVCRRLREQPWASDACIVALTGWGQEADRRRSREAGFDAHLLKPVDEAVLANLLSARR